MPNERKAVTILASFLVFSSIKNIAKLLDYFPEWLAELSTKHNYRALIVVRINNPTLPLAELRARVNELSSKFAGLAGQLKIELVESGHNLGFGGGHNANFDIAKPDYIFVLNDDLAFHDIDWLPPIITRFERDPNLAMVGEITNPQVVSPFFGNGLYPSAPRTHSLEYAEASVLFVRGSAFVAAGLFDEGFEWAMFEDSDLSFRMRQLGYRIEWTEMPHRHWRSTSFNSLPSFAKYSVMEHNRARLFSKWGTSLRAGRIGRWVILDLYCEGMGDAFCALFHINAELGRLTPELRGLHVINTRHPDMSREFLPDDVTITSERDGANLFEKFHGDGGVASVRSIRDVVYSHPFNIHTLLSAGLGVPQADETIAAEVFERFRSRSRPSKSLIPDQPYYVVHLEFMREGHDGRMPSADVCAMILETAIAKCERVVVVGLRKQGLPQRLLGDSRVLDLRESVALIDLIHIIANATGFIGIDSFPAHLAQLSGVPATVVFGSVNPLARVWSESLVWPIVADLRCIGCYHELIEPSAPFCMRRDYACMHEISGDVIGQSIEGMLRRAPFRWDRLRRAFNDRQRSFLHIMEYHPAPPSHFIRPKLPNEIVSNLIYEITSRITSIYGEQLRNAGHMSFVAAGGSGARKGVVTRAIRKWMAFLSRRESRH